MEYSQEVLDVVRFRFLLVVHGNGAVATMDQSMAINQRSTGGDGAVATIDRLINGTGAVAVAMGKQGSGDCNNHGHDRSIPMAMGERTGAPGQWQWQWGNRGSGDSNDHGDDRSIDSNDNGREDWGNGGTWAVAMGQQGQWQWQLQWGGRSCMFYFEDQCHGWWLVKAWKMCGRPWSMNLVLGTKHA
jgi:hypothetical protein